MKYWDRAWNPINGCRECSEGCLNCTAKKQAEYKLKFKEEYDFHNIHILDNILKKPFSKEKEVVMICSQSDLFLPEIKNKMIDAILRKAAFNKQKKFLVVTKYAERMYNYLSDENLLKRLGNHHFNFNLNNIYFGVTVEMSKYLDRIDFLKSCKNIKHRFVAFEPLLEPINVSGYIEDMEFVIVGSESGENARKCEKEWIDNIVNECQSKNIEVKVND